MVSSNGSTAGTSLVWLLRRDDNTLRAYNAEDLSLVWNSKQGTGNGLEGNVVKFTLPIVANGKVYAGTKTSIVCYGLKPAP